MMNMQQQDPSTTYQQQQQQQQQPMMMMKQPPQPQPPPQFPEQEHLKCPRCDSPNTKFCYYNNYNLSQPRHFCKNCRRYWTKGGALRNIPIGGGTRKSTKRSSSSTSNPKRHSSSSSANSTISTPNPSTPPQPPLLIAQNSGLKTEPSSIYGGPVDQDCRMLDITGSLSFSSLLASSGQFGNLLAGLNPNNNGSGIRTMQLGGFSQNLSLDNGLGSDMGRNPDLELQNGHNNNDNSESFLGIQSGGDSSCWSGGGGGGGGGGGSNGWPDLAI